MNNRTWQLLRMLADGAFHSGESLGRGLGVSRATVCNALADVADYGVVLQRIRGRGYRLAQPWRCLDAVEVSRALGGAASRFQLEVLQQAASSNTELLRRAALGAPSGSVLAVELQTAGRGRIGRVWHSGLGNALTFSLLWRFDCGLNALSGLSLAVGVAIVRALNQFNVAGVGLKWPNDILARHGDAGRGKLGGVLIEAQGDMYGPSAVVIGIGLNCSLPMKLSRAITQPAAALDQVCVMPPDRNTLLAALLQELAGVLDEFACSGFAVLRAEWECHHAQQDFSVELQMPDGSRIGGIARGVSETGELCLETAQGMRQFNSGEVGERQ
ncbi:MAG: biotin--[acetyl-CoA-carboxylase] ligase [Gallionella sp.]|nr:biotin--[acetyl-CoA-carboxylase] ligase [Gallionella sp.]